MSNYPIGAAEDSEAPYNQIIYYAQAEAVYKCKEGLELKAPIYTQFSVAGGPITEEFLEDSAREALANELYPTEEFVSIQNIYISTHPHPINRRIKHSVQELEYMKSLIDTLFPEVSLKKMDHMLDIFDILKRSNMTQNQSSAFANTIAQYLSAPKI